MSSSLSLRSIEVNFGKQQVLKGCSFTVQSGTNVAVLGESGSGKSTILRVIAGLTNPESGDVVVDGKVVNAVRTHLRGMAMMSQQATLFPHLDVIDNVAFGIKLKGVRRRESRLRAFKFLEMVGLSHHATRMPQGSFLRLDH